VTILPQNRLRDIRSGGLVAVARGRRWS
jgi:hypothetical protein